MTYLDDLKQILDESENRKIQTTQATKISASKLNALKDIKNSILHTLSSISSYKNFTGDLPAYNQVIDLSDLLRAKLDSLNETISNLIILHEKELDSRYDLNDNISTVYNKIQIMENYKITSNLIETYLLFKSESITLNNQTANFSYLYKPSNIKKTLLFDLPYNENATHLTYGIAYQLFPNTTKKVHKVINVFFFQSALYLIILDLKTKIRKVFCTPDNSNTTNIQLSNYHPKTESFTVIADLPPINTNDLTLSFFNELNKEI